MKKLAALLLITVLLFGLVSCKDNEETPSDDSTESQATESKEPDNSTESGDEPAKTFALTKEFDEANESKVVKTSNAVNGKEYGKDYTSLYEKFGKDIQITDVYENAENGNSYIEKDGKFYLLGLDFLSMAMVYKTEVPKDLPEELKGVTSDDIYATWWRLYQMRWNNTVPEIPLYSNEYYDLYNTLITGVKENPTNPYWGPARALIDWGSDKEDKSFIFGNATDLSGKFRYPAFGASSPGAADNDIAQLVSGLETVVTNRDGGYQWNDTVVKAHEEKVNDDGTKTFKITIKEGLKFSDGSPVTAKNYVITALVFSTPVAAQAAGKDHQAAMTIVGYESFKNYAGAAAEGATKELSGLRLLDDYTLQVTISADYIPYFYDIGYAGFGPEFAKLWLGDCDVKDDGNGCYLTDDFYAKDGDSYKMADHIQKSALNTDTTYPYSGAYVVESYDISSKTAVLKANPNFAGTYDGKKPKIEKIVYKRVISDTQIDDAKAGNLDFIAGITGGKETDDAITMIKDSKGKFDAVHYGRAGYGKLGFRADFGPVQFTEVRQAIAYCMDRATFAKDFTGGYGGVVDGPYYKGAWMYKKAMEQGMELNAYDTSLDSAKDVLVKGGWIYDAQGNEYKEGVRYKKIPASEMQEKDITFMSKDKAYKVEKVGDDYYMPLVINWYGTADNPFTDLLVTGFMENANIKAAGMVVQNTIGDFGPMLDELYQAPVYGFYAGTPLYGAFNFATGFNSAVYDYSYANTIDPSMYDNYSQYFFKDEADFFWMA